MIFTEGSRDAHKLTTVDDLSRMSCLKRPSRRPLVGFGVDIHHLNLARGCIYVALR